LAISAGWIAGNVEVVDEHEDEQAQGDHVGGDRHEPEVSVVDPHHGDHRQQAEQRPLDLRPDRLERIGLGRKVAPHRRRRIDHEDADRREGDDHDEDRVIGRMSLALEDARQVLGRFLIRRAARLLDLLALARVRVGERTPEARDRRGEVHGRLRARAATRSATASLKARPRAA
jgi:hypothetical protein